MSFNAKDMTQGGQIANMRFRMFGQIDLFVIAIIVFEQFVGKTRHELANLSTKVWKRLTISRLLTNFTR